MITYKPTELLRKIAPARKIAKLVTGKLTLNRAILSMFDGIDFISKSTIKDSALSAIKNYKERYAEGEVTKKEVVQDPALLINRVQNAVINQVADEIKTEYRGEFYKWLPSDADTPDPQHQLKYGKTYQIGKGEQPGDRWGCRCGMKIIVPEKKLAL